MPAKRNPVDYVTDAPPKARRRQPNIDAIVSSAIRLIRLEECYNRLCRETPFDKNREKAINALTPIWLKATRAKHALRDAVLQLKADK